MSCWAGLLTDLERVDFELQRSSEAADLARWACQRDSLLEQLRSLDPQAAGTAEQVRLSAALARGEQFLVHWRQARERMRAEASNLHASRLLLQSLQPSRSGAHFSFDS